MADGLKQDGDGEESGKWQPRNWTRKTELQVKRMSKQQKSRYLAYEEPPQSVVEAQNKVKTRLRESRKQHVKKNMTAAEEEEEEREKHEKLIGQLKAAEARNRIRIMRLRYDANKGKEVYHLTMCQPTARKAVRLQALLPTKEEERSTPDKLNKLERARVEALLEDTQGIIIGRT